MVTIEGFEAQAAALRAIYWRLRAERQINKRRRWYRLAAKEKARLAGLGYDQEVTRLYCLWLRNPRLERRRDAYYHAFDCLLHGPYQLPLF